MASRSAASTSSAAKDCSAARASLRAAPRAIPAACSRTVSMSALTRASAASIVPITSCVAAASASWARTSPADWPSWRGGASMLSSSPCVSDRRRRARAGSETTSSRASNCVSKVNFVAFISIDQLVFALLVGDHDLALVGEILGDADHAHLGFIDVFQPHGTHCIHVLAQDLAGALAHVGEEDIAQRVGRALEREAELVFLDVTQQRLDRAGIELAQILEGEHQRLDALGAVASSLFESRDEAAFGLAVEIVEDFGHVLVAVALGGAREVGHELDAQGLLDLVENVLLHAFHPEHALHDLERKFLRQRAQHAGGMFGLDLGEHDGDGLRIFVLQVVRQ